MQAEAASNSRHWLHQMGMPGWRPPPPNSQNPQSVHVHRLLQELQDALVSMQMQQQAQHHQQQHHNLQLHLLQSMRGGGHGPGGQSPGLGPGQGVGDHGMFGHPALQARESAPPHRSNPHGRVHVRDERSAGPGTLRGHSSFPPTPSMMRRDPTGPHAGHPAAKQPAWEQDSGGGSLPPGHSFPASGAPPPHGGGDNLRQLQAYLVQQLARGAGAQLPLTAEQAHLLQAHLLQLHLQHGSSGAPQGSHGSGVDPGRQGGPRQPSPSRGLVNPPLAHHHPTRTPEAAEGGRIALGTPSQARVEEAASALQDAPDCVMPKGLAGSRLGLARKHSGLRVSAPGAPALAYAGVDQQHGLQLGHALEDSSKGWKRSSTEARPWEAASIPDKAAIDDLHNSARHAAFNPRRCLESPM